MNTGSDSVLNLVGVAFELISQDFNQIFVWNTSDFHIVDLDGICRFAWIATAASRLAMTKETRVPPVVEHAGPRHYLALSS